MVAIERARSLLFKNIYFCYAATSTKKVTAPGRMRPGLRSKTFWSILGFTRVSWNGWNGWIQAGFLEYRAEQGDFIDVTSRSVIRLCSYLDSIQM